MIGAIGAVVINRLFVLTAGQARQEERLETNQRDIQATQQDIRVVQQDIQAAQQDIRVAQQDLQVTRQDIQTILARLDNLGGIPAPGD